MQITEVLGLELMVHVSGEEVAFASLEVVLCWPSIICSYVPSLVTFTQSLFIH